MRYAQSASFNLGAKATGTNFSKRIAGPPQAKPVPKDRKPDWVARDQTSPEQAVVYRLSGDYNELHISQFPPHVPCFLFLSLLPCFAFLPSSSHSPWPLYSSSAST